MTVLRLSLLAVLLPVLLTGCCVPHPVAPAAPETGWVDLQTNPSVEPLYSGVDIMIAYGNSSCLHTAMWVATEGDLLFWDPAGGYGVPPNEPHDRRRDVLAIAPSLEEYLDFRWGLKTTEVVEIFRFDLDRPVAARLYRLLREGSEGSPEYNPATPGMFCSKAVSGFLAQFAPTRFPLKEPYLYPHVFAAVLYDLNPDQVFLVPRDKKAKVLPARAARP